jgi:ribose transport system substrate-binding protein
VKLRSGSFITVRIGWRTAVVALLACTSFALAACGSSNGDSGGAGGGEVKVALGGGHELTWKKTPHPKVAFFSYAHNNSWTSAEADSAKATAKKLGFDLTIFDPKGDAQTQFNQMQTALSSGKFAAWTFVPVDSSLICSVVKQAIAKGIAVINQQAGICGRDTKSGNEVLEPGLLGFSGGIGANQNVWNSVADYVSKDNPGPTKAIVLTGTAGVPQTIAAENGMKKLKKDRPDFNILGSYVTDYSEQSGFNLTQQALQQHPDLKVIISIYAGITTGARQAVKQAGLEHKIKIYDVGGNQPAVDAVRSGDQTMTVPQFPATQTKTALEILDQLNKGKLTGPVIKMNDGSTLGGASGGTFFVDKSNAATFNAEYN